MSLTTDDLVSGDILLKKYFGGFVHWFIRGVTANEGPSSNFVHAAVHLGQGMVAESTRSGQGFVIADLMNQGENYEYQVCRYSADPELAEIAAHIASTWVRMRGGEVAGYSAGPGFGGYGLNQGLSAAFQNRMNRNLSSRPGEGASFWGSGGQPGVSSSFCSQFAVEAYNAAGATCAPPRIPINLAANRATPAMLYNELVRSPDWTVLEQSIITR